MKNYYLVLDVETAGDIQKPLVYDLGFAIVNQKGEILEKRSYVISDIFFHGRDNLTVSELMETAYYSEKLPQYYAGIKNGKGWKIDTFYHVRKEMLKLMSDYKVKAVCAYKAGFDTRALNNTMRFLTNGKYQWFFPWNTTVYCIWHMACQTICNTKKYRAFCEANQFVNKSGNIQTTVEAVWSYLTENVNFQEKHTGLEDVKIEAKIMAQCFKTHKKLNREINEGCWRIPQRKKTKKN